MIDVGNLSFRYGSQPPLFDQFSWQVREGETWTVLGVSGCGKTTLLYLLSGLLLPTSGSIRIKGEALTRPRPETGLILQDFGLLPWATVRENALLGLQIRRFYGPDGKHAPASAPAAENASDVDRWLQRLSLEGVKDHYPAQISGGQRQRTAIARTLVLQPDLLLMDEPFAALDAPTREGLQAFVRQIGQERTLTTVLVTHLIEEALYVGDKILLLTGRPNCAPLVYENPYAGNFHSQSEPGYQSLLTALREELREQSA